MTLSLQPAEPFQIFRKEVQKKFMKSYIQRLTQKLLHLLQLLLLDRIVRHINLSVDIRFENVENIFEIFPNFFGILLLDSPESESRCNVLQHAIQDVDLEPDPAIVPKIALLQPMQVLLREVVEIPELVD